VITVSVQVIGEERHDRGVWIADGGDRVRPVVLN
jgi:hypothetical protein